MSKWPFFLSHLTKWTLVWKQHVLPSLFQGLFMHVSFYRKKKKKKRQKSHFIKTFLRGMCTHTHTIFHPALPIHFRCYQQTFNEVFFIWFATQKLTWHTAFIIYNSFFFFFIRHMTANPRSFSVQWKLIDYWQVPRFKMSITSWSFLLHLFNANLRSEVLLKGKR